MNPLRAPTLVMMASLIITMPVVAQSPYAGQEKRGIKALSDREQADLLAGKGMGLAKAAELNGYPGPLHVLELADPLALSDEQRRATQALFDRMQAEASELGRQLVAAEAGLDGQFASGTVTAETLERELAMIGDLQARLRGVHLATHLEQKALLTEAQVTTYIELRGYHSGHGEHGGRHGH